MRFACQLCSMSSTSIKRLISHYEMSHMNSFKIKCGIQDCQVSFTNVISYRRHVRKKHSFLYDPHFNENAASYTDNPSTSSISDQSIDPQLEIFSETFEDYTDIGDEVEPVQFDYHDLLSDILLDAREEQKVTTAATQFVCNEMQKLVSHSWKIHNENMDIFIRDDLSEIEKNELKAFQERIPLVEALHKFTQEKSLDRYIQGKDTFVMPIEIELGINDKGKKDTFQYVPILETLKVYVCHQDVIAEVLHNREESEVITSIKDGSHIKMSAFFSKKETLLINLYNDEFTISNPLGNKTKNYKILAFYFTLGNLSPRLNSKLKSIQLAIVAKHTHAKRYGAAAILAPLIDDLKVLETKGLQIDFLGQSYLFHGSVSMVISDNMAAHWLFGFQESFSKTKRVCRFCMCIRDDISTCTNADQCVMRTEESHRRHLNGIEANPALIKEYGIKADCPLNVLKYFHCTTGFPGDVAHDLFEGVCFNIMSDLIIHFVREGLFTLEELNIGIELFNYQRCDRRDKPQPFTISCALDSFKVKLTAVESWNFCRLFPLMFGSQIDNGDGYWEVLLLLLDYLDEVMAHKFDMGSTYYLDEKFDELMTLYTSFFPDGVKPKMHFCIHYGSQTREFGPPRSRFTLRYESKNFSLKEPMTRSKNRINICKSIAFRHQSRMHKAYKRELFFTTENIYVSQKMEHFDLLPHELKKVVEKEKGDEEHMFVFADGLKTESVEYHKKDVVVVGYDSTYLFGIVHKIIQISGKPFIYFKKLDTLLFETHFHAYEVEESGEYLLIQVEGLYDYHPLGMYCIDNRKFVPLKQNIYNH